MHLIVRPAGRPLVLATGLLVLGLALSGCGRKGELDRPGAMPPKPAAAAQADPADTSKTDVEDNSFILDPLL